MQKTGHIYKNEYDFHFKKYTTQIVIEIIF